MPQLKGVIVECDTCREDAKICLCQSHYDEKIEEAIEYGKQIGRAEAEEEFKKSDEE